MMMYTYDVLGNYTGAVEHVKGAALPRRYTLIAPPEGEYAVWTSEGWILQEKPVEPVSNWESRQKMLRQSAYQRESDPIFFLMQRGEATQEEWQAKITEIKERYPYYYDDEGNLLEAQE